jgi:putative inorganic carbon (hco3(-)) transporter
MDWFVAFFMVVPAGYLLLKRSPALVDYLIWVTVLNRGVRRYVDWLAGEFNPLSPISLTPLVVAACVFLLVMQNYSRLPAHFRKIMGLFGIALGLAFTVGLVRNQLAAVYALAEYVAPLSVMACAVMAGGNERVLDRWIRTVGWAAVVVCLYGWWQYYTIPAWDAFWVESVGFVGYLGQLRPTEMVVFSTMAERGPLAGFLAFAVVPMMLSARWRTAGGWFGVALILSTILLTFVRSSVILVVIAAILYPALNRGRGSIRVVIFLAVAALLANFTLGNFAGSERVSERLETLGSIADDGSFRGRIAIARYGISQVLKNPLGTGLGSTGLAGRVNTGDVEAGALIGDNGYLSLLFSLGWIGGICFFAAFRLIWQTVRRLERLGLRLQSAMMFKTLFVTGAIALIAGDWLSGPGSLIFMIFCGFAVNPESVDSIRKHWNPEGRPVVAVFGRLARWKGQLLLLKVARQIPEIMVWVVGGAFYTEDDRAYAGELRALAGCPQLSGRVAFPGHVQNIPAWMKAADVIVHTSIAPEPFGRVIVEGMLAGKPVVAADAGGASGIIDNGRFGLPYPPGDETAFHDALREALRGGPAIDEMVGRASREARATYSLERVLARTHEVVDPFLEP